MIARGVRVITDRDRLVHVSGHPRRDEMREMYGWIKPRSPCRCMARRCISPPMPSLRVDMGVPIVKVIGDGDMLRLAPGPAEKVDEVEAGRIYTDGTLIGNLEAMGVPDRRRLSFAGHVAVSVVLDDRGEIAADPEIELIGLPLADRDGRPFQESVMDAVLGALDSIPRAAATRPRSRPRGGAPRGAGRRRVGLGQEAELHGARLGPMTRR